ncbi:MULTISPECIES: hypothetical protein [unclassified Nocardia]|uniref:hypothetical protein n=1 Tax=unclassified Nocardia TaxID=2637762 RepID=UPI0034362DB4
MANYSVDLNELISAARAWGHASDSLGEAATKAQNIQNSNKEVVWAVFQDAWDAQVAAAQYMYNRLTEGATETDSIGAVLEHVAKVYQEQDQNFANAVIKLDEGY